jgi:hypothetical protein
MTKRMDRPVGRLRQRVRAADCGAGDVTGDGAGVMLGARLAALGMLEAVARVGEIPTAEAVSWETRWR